MFLPLDLLQHNAIVWLGMQNEIGRYGDIIEAKKGIYMNARIVNMLEAIKVETYIIYTDYLENTDIDAICQWSYPIISGNRDEIEKVISLMYEYM